MYFLACRMAARFPAVDEHAIALPQLVCLLLIGKFSFARQNDKAKERHQIRPLGCMRMDGLQGAGLLQMEQGCSGKG